MAPFGLSIDFQGLQLLLSNDRKMHLKAYLINQLLPTKPNKESSLKQQSEIQAKA